jgi:exodeoxyribonuclease V alpha subunit
MHNTPDISATWRTLLDWTEQGSLRRLDSAMAHFVHQHDAKASPALLVASALLAHMEGRGHVCLPLRDLVMQPQSVLLWPDNMQASLNALWAELPKGLSAWLKALTRSPVVRCAWVGEPSEGAASAQGGASDDGGQPLVLGGTPDQPLLYLRRYWVYEQQVAQAMAERTKALPEVDTAAARYWLDRLFPVSTRGRPAAPPTDAPDALALSHDWQKMACALALRSGLTVITGGPGTGKTYTAARLLALLLATSANPSQLRVALAAPTGKAAARLRQAIDQSLASLQIGLGQSIDLKSLTDRLGKASTVHALLGLQAGSRQFKHNAQRPLDLDVLVVDETSMVHLEMMAALMQAMPAHAKLVLLGDKDQLASVEVGSVLGDLCAHAQDNLYNPSTCDYLQATCGEVLQPSPRPGSPLDQQTVMLRHSHRFGSDIGALAKAVNRGIASTTAPQDLFEPPSTLGAYALLARGTQQAHAALADTATGAPHPARADVGKVYAVPAPVKPEAVVRLALQGRPHAPACFADYLRIMQAGPEAVVSGDAGDAQNAAAAAHNQWVVRVLQAFERFRILCAVHDGDWGDRQLNLQVQRALAEQGLLKPEGEWFAGRPVMVTRNDKSLGVFNGDVGVVLPGLASKALRVWFLEGTELRSVSVSRLAHVETAFAMTIHKSQGSEFAHAVVVLPDTGGDLLTRELVYTGITRAKEHLTLVEPRAGLLAEAMARQVQRASGLAHLANAR